jgi:antitoxin (DNA-binding transcriptional repressor) of toxin-antitoxin stability system
VVISNRNKPVARLVAVPKPPVVRTLGWGGRDALWMADDFDAPLADFADSV